MLATVPDRIVELRPPTAPSKQPSRRTARSALGERLGGFIYGTIVVLSVIVAGARAYPDRPGRIAALAVVTTVVFWLAHVYAHAVGESVAREEHLSLAKLGHVARHEGAIVEAAVPPVAALLLGALGIVSSGAALWTAFILGMVVLAAEGLVFARVEGLRWPGTVGAVAANLSLGLVLVALKLFLSH
jgi:hypothetical protein